MVKITENSLSNRKRRNVNPLASVHIYLCVCVSLATKKKYMIAHRSVED